MIINRTPFRVSIVGGGSDFPEFYRRHGGGAVVSFAIDKYLYLSMHPLFDRESFLLKYSKTEHAAKVEDIEHRLIRQVFSDYNIKGVDFNSSADVPAGTGLGSSSAFTVGLAQLCDAYTGKYQSKENLAKYACVVEIEKLGDPIGKQDQYACACGGLNYIRFEPDESVLVEKLCLNAESIARINSRLMLFYTGTVRSAAQVLREQRHNMLVYSDKADLLRKIAAMAEELRQGLYRGDIDSIGDALHRGWMYKRELASGITNDGIDALYETAMKAGAMGGKLLGAGGGGFLLLYASPERQAGIRHALRDLMELPFKIDNTGVMVIHYDDSTTAPPRREAN